MNNSTLSIQENMLQLESSCNFRDIGGYLTQDGRQVKRGMLFRSGVMAYFSEQDKQRIATLGIKVICDLRRSDERIDEPTAWPNIEDVKFIIERDEPELELKGRSWMDARTGDEVQEHMTHFYRQMPVWLLDRLASVFEQLIDGQLPLVFHCSAGKDRTGLTAALILHTLGVERDLILKDYDLTNHVANLEAFMIKHKKSRMGLTDQEHPVLKIPKHIRRIMFNADVNYLIAAFDQIEKDYGSVDTFLNQKIGISPKVQAELRDQLLIAPSESSGRY